MKAQSDRSAHSVLAVFTLLLASAAAPISASDLVVSGVVDGPLSGGIPKAVELFATADIPDLSIYGVGSANNGGGGADGEEFTFPAVALSAGSHIYVASESTGFMSFFGSPLTTLRERWRSTNLIEGNDIGTIDVGFLTRSRIQVDSVSQVDPDATFVNPITFEDDILHDRPPLYSRAAASSRSVRSRLR